MMNKIFAIVLLASASQASAAETRAMGATLNDLLSGKSLYADGIEQMFHSDGVTFYMSNGNVSQGTWKIVDDQYCSSWPPNPALVCYNVMTDGDTVTFISKSGSRSVMRTVK